MTCPGALSTSRPGTRATGWLVVLGALVAAPRPAAAQLSNQRFEVIPDKGQATVGDRISLRLRVRLDERDLLYDTVPRAMTVPPGVRLLTVEKLQRGADRLFTGQAVVAFYRPGRQAAPVFALDFMRGVKGVLRATLSIDTAFIEIKPVAAPGNPALKDIKQIVRRTGPDPLLLGLGLGALATAVAAVGVGRRRRVAPRIATAAPRAAPADPTPYDRARRRLAELDALARDGGISPAACVEETAEVVREYLTGATGLPAQNRTTTELLEILLERPEALALGEQPRLILGSGDLVKFALAEPDAASAERLIDAARSMLEECHRRLKAGTGGHEKALEPQGSSTENRL